MKNQRKKMKTKSRDFRCDCGCGQKLRIVYLEYKNYRSLDFGVMESREKRPKVGVVLRNEDKNNFKKILDFLLKCQT